VPRSVAALCFCPLPLAVPPALVAARSERASTTVQAQHVGCMRPPRPKCTDLKVHFAIAHVPYQTGCRDERESVHHATAAGAISAGSQAPRLETHWLQAPAWSEAAREAGASPQCVPQGGPWERGKRTRYKRRRLVVVECPLVSGTDCRPTSNRSSTSEVGGCGPARWLNSRMVHWGTASTPLPQPPGPLGKLLCSNYTFCSQHVGCMRPPRPKCTGLKGAFRYRSCTLPN
jgi:hypothetical protein